ncbi:hypothetical protein QQ045_012602 [Rhodiola kirilowii]
MGRSPCCEKAHTNKGAWTKEEDDRLISYIRAHGEGCWRSLPTSAGLLRCGKSCRLRWINYLRPDLKRGNFTQDEDHLIIKLHTLLGNKRKLLNRGIDPATHRVINDPLVSFGASNINAASRDQVEEDQMIKVEQFPLQEDIMDLNLELKISPPSCYQYHKQQEAILKNGRRRRRRRRRNNSAAVCFACSLGLKNNKDCSCGNKNKCVIVDHDFLGSSVLEMK